MASRLLPAHEVLVEAWTRALAKDYLRPHVAPSPEGRVLLPYDLLHRADLEAAEALVADAGRGLRAIREALGTDAQVGIARLGAEHRVAVRNVRPQHLGRLVAIEGLVKRATVVRPGVLEAKWRCRKCLALMPGPAALFGEAEAPYECHEDDGGCSKNKNGAWDFDEDHSVKVATQKLDVQDAPDNLRGGEVPGQLPVHLTLDLCGQAYPGDRVTVTGVLRDHRKKKTQGRVESVSEFHLEAVHVDVQRTAYEDIVIAEEDEAAIRRLAADPRLYELLEQSIAPSIYGLLPEKRALALQLFGGVRRTNADGTTVRGDIHLGIFGDPGLAKSQLLRYAARLSPRGIYTDGTGASGAGLTAGAVKDEDTGRWAYEAGSLVLAHGGLCAVDEVEKMGEDDQGRMLVALEQGVVKLTKTGLDLELPAQCSVLFAGNPRDGRFDVKYESIAAQVDLPPYLLSRLDLLFVILDRVDEVRDRETMTHIIFRNAAEPSIKSDLLRKFIAFARRSCDPVLSQGAGERIVDYYVALRRKKADPVNAEKKVVTSTPREGEGLARLAAAAARARLSATVEVRDVEVGIGLMDECLSRLDWDKDKVITGTGATKRDAIGTIRGLVAKAEPSGGVTREEVLAVAWREHGIPERRAGEILDELWSSGALTVSAGRFKRKEAA